MSLGKTSHPDRPGPDELIRSGYALRVGEIDALVEHCMSLSDTHNGNDAAKPSAT